MSLADTTWSQGRYHTRHIYFNTGASAVDLTGGTGDKATFRVLHPRIQILEFGLIALAAFPNLATMTTRPVVALDHVAADDATRTEITKATATDDYPITRLLPDYEQLINSVVTKDLDLKQLANPIAGPPTFTEAVEGDTLVVELMTSGVGGTQSAQFFVRFRELEP